MRFDTVNKVAIWVIAVSLLVIALRPAFSISPAYAADSSSIVPFASQGAGVFWAYDRRDLGIWVYDTRNGKGFYLGKLTSLGQKMDQEGVTQIPFVR